MATPLSGQRTKNVIMVRQTMQVRYAPIFVEMQFVVTPLFIIQASVLKIATVLLRHHVHLSTRLRQYTQAAQSPVVQRSAPT